MSKPTPEERFFKLYANLPLNLRAGVIAVVSNEPISWKVAYLEISGKTKRGNEILKQLVNMNFI
ncbi:MAG: hypothetical protein ABH814_01520 [bacterium]